MKLMINDITQPLVPNTVDINRASSTALVLLSWTFQAITVALFTLMLTCTHSYRPTVYRTLPSRLIRRCRILDI